MRKIAFAPVVLLACASTNTTFVDERSADLPPSVTMTASGAEVRTSNPDRGVMEEFAAPPDRVFEALLAVLEDYDLEPDNLDPPRRRVGVSRVTRTQIAGEKSSDLTRCANQGAGPSAASRFRITIELQAAVANSNKGSMLQMLVGATASPIDGTSVGRVACVSTGRLEERINYGVALKLGLSR